jgi:C-terminal processing protease CtpA/Prc
MRLLVGLFIFLATTLAAQKPFNPNKKYHPDSLKRWTKSVMQGISEKHPGFYRYTPKEKFDRLIDSTAQTIQDSLTELDYYRKMKPLFAQIGCLHTGISLSSDYENYLIKTSTLIPIEIFIDADKKVLLTKNYDSLPEIKMGSEIVSINGRPISDILRRLLNAIPSDGYNQTEKTLLLNHRFSFWYQTVIEVAPTYAIDVKEQGMNKTYVLQGVSEKVFPNLQSLESNYQKPLEFERVNNTGILKVHSFAKSAAKNKGQNFKKFIKATFREIEKNGVENLIVDLRYNTGGTDGNAAYLAAYFFNKPFRYWDKIEVTEAIAEEIKGLNRLFYRKPKKSGDSYRWRKTWLTNEFNYYETLKPAKRYFPGTTYLLTNGLCLSSCSDFVAVLSHNKKALVVGQESGGGFQGNTSGMMPTASIPTGLQVTVPLMKYTNAVDSAKHFGRGTIPEYEVTPTFDSWMNKVDIEMEFVWKLINRSRGI